MADPTPGVPGTPIGEVVGYFAHVGAAVVALTGGPLAVGETIWIKGHTTDLKQTVTSIQVDHAPITAATRGQEVAIRVSDRVRRHDRLYKLP